MEKEKMIWRNSSVSLNVTAGKIDSYRKNEETKNTVRVYDDGKIGVAGSLGEFDDGRLMEAAKNSLGYGIEYTCELNANRKREEEIGDIIPEKEFMPRMHALLDRFSTECPKLAVSNKINISRLSSSYENSLGASLLSISNSMEFTLLFQNKGSGNLFDYGYCCSVGKYDEDAVMKDCRLMYDAFYNPVDIEEGEYPVFMTAGDLLGTTVTQFYANTYASGASLLSGRLGERVFSEKFTFCDDRNPQTAHGSCFFDDEGEFAEGYRQVLVKDGVLKSILTCKQLSRMFELPFAATAGAAYDGVPSFGFNSGYIKSTANSVREITSDKAVLIVEAGGGDMTPDGHFATPVQLAFLVENGEIKGKLPDIGVSGEYFDLLGKDYLGAADNAFFPSMDMTYMACRMKVSR